MNKRNMKKDLLRSMEIAMGNEIRKQREKLKLTQGQMAHEMGVDQSRLCRMEQGYVLTIPNLFLASKVFDCSLGNLFHKAGI